MTTPPGLPLPAPRSSPHRTPELSCPVRRAVFLDRDDTLVECRSLPARAFASGRPGDLADPAFVRLLPGVREACTTLRDAGFALVIVSNQGVVARGGASPSQVEATHARVRELLHDDHGRTLIDASYGCPFHPEGRVSEYTREHPWRKPAPGMLLAAARDLHLDLAHSWLIGDADRDALSGVNAGLAPERALVVGPGRAHADMPSAAAHILAHGARRA